MVNRRGGVRSESILNLGLEMGLGALVIQLNKQLELDMLQVDLLLECLLMLMLLKPVHRLSQLNLEWVAMPIMAIQLQW